MQIKALLQGWGFKTEQTKFAAMNANTHLITNAGMMWCRPRRIANVNDKEELCATPSRQAIISEMTA